jgi:hypothetical protein
LDVTFVVPDEPDLESRVTLDPDRDWQIMRRKQRWVLQTYLRLARAGFPVRVSARPPKRGIVVFHARHANVIRPTLARNSEITLVAIRGDYRESLLADYEVVQNGRWADGKRRIFVPYWPQPGLIPRDPSRAQCVRNVSYKGFDNNLHPYFDTQDWKDWIRFEGFVWIRDSLSHAPSERDGVTVDWHDYSKTDVVLAFRPDPRRSQERRGFTSKPASKLCNAWHARTVAILGPEYAYRELRRTSQDFIEIDRPIDAKRALLELRRSPDLYSSMVENGEGRANEFGHERILNDWVELLFEHIPCAQPRRGNAITGRLPHSARIAGRWCRRVLARRPAR